MATDTVWMTHPTLPGEVVEVPEYSFTSYWQTRGWVITTSPTGASSGYGEFISPAELEARLAGITGGDPETIQDVIAAALVAGTNVTITYDDPNGKITIASTGGGSGGSVTSVAGKTGAVTLVKADVSDLGTIGTAAALDVPTSGNATTSQVVKGSDGRLSDARTPTTHSHVIADLPVATSGTSSATQLTRADDSRLSNSRTPTAHAASHASGGGDQVTPAAIGAATASHSHPVGDLTATGTKSATTFLRGDNTWAVPAGGGSTAKGPGPEALNLPTGQGFYRANMNWNAGLASTLAAPVSGRLYAVRIWLDAGEVVSNLTFMSGTTAGATLTHTYFSLYDSSRALLAQSADDTSATWAVSTPKTLAMTSAYTVTTSGWYYAGITIIGTTMPTLVGVSATGPINGFGTLPAAASSNTGLSTGVAPNPANAFVNQAPTPIVLVS